MNDIQDELESFAVDVQATYKVIVMTFRGISQIAESSCVDASDIDNCRQHIEECLIALSDRLDSIVHEYCVMKEKRSDLNGKE